MLKTVFCGFLLAERKHIFTAVIYRKIITKQQKKAWASRDQLLYET